jgi:uncharacterized OB-fold protein
LVGLVELDEGVRILSFLTGISENTAKIGMKLRVTWERLSEEINMFSFTEVN